MLDRYRTYWLFVKFGDSVHVGPVPDPGFANGPAMDPASYNGLDPDPATGNRPDPYPAFCK
jgi:hypothetical protein